MDIQVKNIDHLGIVAGIVDQIGLVAEIDRHIEKHPQQLISTGQVIKAMNSKIEILSILDFHQQRSQR